MIAVDAIAALQEVEAFGGHEAALQRITDAYMRVHYGDQGIAQEDLRQTQEDYRSIRDDLT